MRIIDADEFKAMSGVILAEYDAESFVMGMREILDKIRDAPTIPTKQVKYFDEDEKVWKIGSVIVE